MTFNDLPTDVQQHWIVHWNAIQADFPNSLELKKLARNYLKGVEEIPPEIPTDSDGWPHPAYIHDYIEELLGLTNG